MLKEAMEYILALGKPTIQEFGDHVYSDRKFHPVMDPVVSELDLCTLQGFVEAIIANVNWLLPNKPCVVHVKNYNRVQLLDLVPDKWARRTVHLDATAQEFPDSAFNFDRYVDQETFIIALHSRFVDNQAKTELLGLVSRLTSEMVGLSEDNGVSQNVTLRKGVALKENRDINPRVTLQPYRTFVEVEQPASDFIFRVRSNPDQRPQCGLWEADGGKWKIEAMRNIKVWLEEQKVGFPVIA